MSCDPPPTPSATQFRNYCCRSTDEKCMLNKYRFTGISYKLLLKKQQEERSRLLNACQSYSCFQEAEAEKIVLPRICIWNRCVSEQASVKPALTHFLVLRRKLVLEFGTSCLPSLCAVATAVLERGTERGKPVRFTLPRPCMYVCLRERVCVCVSVYVCMYIVCMHACMHASICVCVCVYIYIMLLIMEKKNIYSIISNMIYIFYYYWLIVLDCQMKWIRHSQSSL